MGIGFCFNVRGFGLGIWDLDFGLRFRIFVFRVRDLGFWDLA